MTTALTCNHMCQLFLGRFFTILRTQSLVKASIQGLHTAVGSGCVWLIVADLDWVQCLPDFTWGTDLFHVATFWAPSRKKKQWLPRSSRDLYLNKSMLFVCWKKWSFLTLAFSPCFLALKKNFPYGESSIFIMRFSKNGQGKPLAQQLAAAWDAWFQYPLHFWPSFLIIRFLGCRW